MQYYSDMQSHRQAIILWDLDGTLVKSRRLNSKFSSHNIFLNSLGFKINRYLSVLSGLTDYEILVNILIINRISLKNLNLSKMLEKYDNFYSETYLEESIVPIIEIEKLNTLRENFEFGVLTGNTKMRCMLKLERVGFEPELETSLIFYCDGKKSRINLVQTAYQEICIKLKKNIVIIGDTPNDVLAGNSLGIPVISIATGKYSVTELRAINKGLVLKKFDKIKIANFISNI
jgi:phosphoglycolate phosphatase